MKRIKLLLLDLFIFVQLLLYLFLVVFFLFPFKWIDRLLGTHLFDQTNRLIRYIGNL
ncbi:MAG: hypothetical protein AAF990_18830 [Bacteroidota bacterium]